MRWSSLISRLFGLVVLSSCGGDDWPSRRVPVEIYHVDIPAVEKVGQEVSIGVEMSASSGCYSTLASELVRIDSWHFLLKATGAFSSTGFCPDIMVYRDTTLHFLPSGSGTYFFQINEAPFKVVRDTLMIN